MFYHLYFLKKTERLSKLTTPLNCMDILFLYCKNLRKWKSRESIQSIDRPKSSLRKSSFIPEKPTYQYSQDGLGKKKMSRWILNRYNAIHRTPKRADQMINLYPNCKPEYNNSWCVSTIKAKFRTTRKTRTIREKGEGQVEQKAVESCKRIAFIPEAPGREFDWCSIASMRLYSLLSFSSPRLFIYEEFRFGLAFCMYIHRCCFFFGMRRCSSPAKKNIWSLCGLLLFLLPMVTLIMDKKLIGKACEIHFQNINTVAWYYFIYFSIPDNSTSGEKKIIPPENSLCYLSFFNLKLLVYIQIVFFLFCFRW